MARAKEKQKKSKQMEGKVRLQWATATHSKTGVDMDRIVRLELVCQGAVVTIGAAPRGA